MYIKLLIIGALTLFSCKSKKTNNNERKYPQTYHNYTDTSGFNLLKLEDVKASKDSLYIRIWITFSLIDSGKIINLKRDKGRWSCEFIQYRLDIDNIGNRFVITRNSTPGIPKKDWDTFLGKLGKLDINDLNDGDRTFNFGLCNDPNSISVEIVNDKKYSQYIFPCWDAIEDQTQINKLIKILKLFENEFSFDIFPIL